MSEALPLFPLGAVLFPGRRLPLRVFEERYRRLMRDRDGCDPIFGVVLTRRGREVGDQPDIFDVGTAATLVASRRYADGRYELAVRGGRRFRVVSGDWGRGYLVAEVDWLPEEPESGSPDLAELAADVGRAALGLLAALVGQPGNPPGLSLPSEPAALAWTICVLLPIDTWERQRLLEAETVRERLLMLAALVRRGRDLLRATGAGGVPLPHPGTGLSVN